MPRSRRLPRSSPAIAQLALGLAAALLFAPRQVGADDGWPVIVTAVGTKPVRIVVTSGLALPCDSDANITLYKGWLKPGDRLQLSTPQTRVCFQQTYANFPDVNWSKPRTVDVERVCSGNRRPCQYVPGKVVSISVPSDDPH